jgi:drug/metabolite transporter (DMT)-like permease
MDLRAIVLGLLFAVLWSSAFATARIIVADAPPMMALAFRFLISGAIALIVARALGQIGPMSKGQWRATVVFGLCQNVLYLGLNFISMQWIEASLAAIIASSMPLLVGALGWMFLGQRLRALGVAGLIVGFSGVALIMGARFNGGADPTGIALCVAGSLALAVATLAVRGASGGGNLWQIVGLQMLVGAATLLVLSLVFEDWHVKVSPRWAAAFFYQILFPGLAATMIWFTLVGRIGAVKASAFHFLNPFFGVLTAVLLLGETIRLTDMIGVAIVMAGILAVQISRDVPKAG